MNHYPLGNPLCESSFIIPCSPDQAEEAMLAWHLIHTFEDGYPLHMKKVGAILRTPDTKTDYHERIAAKAISSHPDYCPSGEEPELFWGCILEVVDSGVWVHGDENLYREGAAAFTHAVLSVYDIDELVTIRVAQSSDVLDIDAFGGSVSMVSKSRIIEHGLDDFIESERQAFNSKSRYFVASITKDLCTHDETSSFLMTCCGDEDPEEKLTDTAMEWLGGDGIISDDSRTITFLNCDATVSDRKFYEISAYEYSIVGKHMQHG